MLEEHSPTSPNSKKVLPTVYSGGAEGIRTPDFLRAKEALSRTELRPHKKYALPTG